MPSPAFTNRSETVLTTLLAGASIRDAAREAEVSTRTVKRWLARGRAEPSSAYGPFARRFDAAQTLREAPAPEPLTGEEFQQLLDGAVRARASWAMRLWDERSQRRRSQPASAEEAWRLLRQ